MTNQEAIECLREMIDKPFPLTLAKIEALKMGVEALEGQIRSDTE